jgi:hypothetical protein
MPTQDTIAKRLMSNKNKFHVKDLNQLIFRAAADKSVGTKFLSLFPGELDSTSAVLQRQAPWSRSLLILLIIGRSSPATSPSVHHETHTTNYTGLGYAAGYKIAQRVYKFGGQPYFRDLIDGQPWLKNEFVGRFGEKNGKMLIHAAAGR